MWSREVTIQNWKLYFLLPFRAYNSIHWDSLDCLAEIDSFYLQKKTTIEVLRLKRNANSNMYEHEYEKKNEERIHSINVYFHQLLLCM